MDDYVCPRCFMNFEGNNELILHLTRETICNLKIFSELGDHEKQSKNLMSTLDTKHLSGEINRKIVNSQAESREFLGKNPANSRKIPNKLTKKAGKLPTYLSPGNSRKTLEFYEKLNLSKNGTDEEIDEDSDDNLPIDERNERKKFICDICDTAFSTKHNMNRHKGRKHNIETEPTITTQLTPIQPLIVKPQLKLKTNLVNVESESRELQEIKKLHEKLNKLNEIEEKLAKLDEVDERLNKLEINPNTIIKHSHNNNLNVLCVSDQNYLDMLTEQWGFDRALEFIQNCALSNMTGDCKLLEKIYFDGVDHDPPIRYLDKNKTKLEFLNEKHEKVIDVKGVQLIRKLVSNLQNSYLKGVNFLINRNLANKKCPNKFLGEYDIQTWNDHIYTLCDFKYQKKLLSQIDIPCIKPF